VSGEQPMGGAGQPSEEELRAAFEEQLRRIRVDDVLVQTAVTLVNLAGRRMGLPGPDGEREAEPDHRQAKLAIDGIRALVPLLPPEPQAAVRDALSQLQMAFATAVRAAGPGEGESAAAGARDREPGTPAGDPPASPGQGQPTPPRAPDNEAQAKENAEAERAKARSKIWTPPGS